METNEEFGWAAPWWGGLGVFDSELENRRI